MADTNRWGILGIGQIARAFADVLKDTPGAVHAAAALSKKQQHAEIMSL